TLGGYAPDSLVNDPGALTTTILGHAMVRVNLVISIEWPAQAEYVNSLAQSIRHAGNYLYDVTNGQACLGKVAIYDDKARWADADIRIYAMNTLQPQTKTAGSQTVTGMLMLPPKWHGNPSLGPNGIVVEHPLDPNTSVHYRTLIHELGHYVFGFFDEYIDAAGGAIHRNINFGFMDSQYEDANDPYTSEMSANATPQYQSTKQFARHGKSCWQYFRDSYTKKYGGLWVEFVAPQDAPRPAGIDYVPGPNDIVTTPDVAIDREMVITSTATGSTAAGHLTLLTAGGNESGKADVTLRKGLSRTIDLGTSNDYGWFRFLGADVGDIAFASYEKNGKYHRLEWSIPPPLLTSPSPQGALSDVVDLLPVAGSVRILSAVEFDPGGEAQFIARSTTGFSTAPVIEMLQEGIAPSAYTLSGDSTTYQTAITESLWSAQQFLFRAPDSLGQQFFVFHHHMLVTTDSFTTEIVGEMVNIGLEFDSTAGGITEISVLSSDFPPPDSGIPPGQVRVSPVYALHNAPTTEVLAGRLTITYTVLSSTAGAIIYHWQNGWIPLVTLVDSSRSMASAHIGEQGYYAVFLDSTSIIIDGIGQQFDELPQEFKLHQNYPNPFNPSTTIRYELPNASYVTLKVFNVLGQEVAGLVDEEKPAGAYTMNLNASNLPSAVYFYRMRTEGFVQTRKLILVR
ncbi:MAG TPA: T9SS type A sorting domain-containing protein, partial [Bacteroidota bacterium]|nr:T9SS type A sorting domain-containing protein [Bacteroidota bacterium]